MTCGSESAINGSKKPPRRKIRSSQSNRYGYYRPYLRPIKAFFGTIIIACLTNFLP